MFNLGFNTDYPYLESLIILVIILAVLLLIFTLCLNLIKYYYKDKGVTAPKEDYSNKENYPDTDSKKGKFEVIAFHYDFDEENYRVTFIFNNNYVGHLFYDGEATINNDLKYATAEIEYYIDADGTMEVEQVTALECTLIALKENMI